MKHSVVTPSVGESITEVSILKWSKESGQAVKSGDLLCEIESDKATVEIVAEHNGVITIMKPAGERLPIGETIAVIDEAGTATVAAAAPPAAAQQKTVSSAPVGASNHATAGSSAMAFPSAQKMMTEQGIDAASVKGTGKDGRITKGDVMEHSTRGSAPSVAAPVSAPSKAPAPSAAPAAKDRPGDRRVPMSMLRSRIAERLVQAQHTAAILTTFNEVDMSAVMALRAKNKDAFKAKHGVNLGFMSFFTKACVGALQAIPEVNATIDGKDTVYHDYYDIGVAVGTERGLVVPVVRDADKMDFPAIEKKIAELGQKGRDGKLSIADLTGGTFTISNGGVYGSLLSTPILNPPQSGILGMHKIQERPVVINGKIEIRPMMYLALSYDHRLIDGKGAVTFLVTVKDLLENPEKLGFTF
jgi:2-oxoglutarate dehydrogenase E2 component (dihydrolipoamide succinyltransferase)